MICSISPLAKASTGLLGTILTTREKISGVSVVVSAIVSETVPARFAPAPGWKIRPIVRAAEIAMMVLIM